MTDDADRNSDWCALMTAVSVTPGGADILNYMQDGEWVTVAGVARAMMITTAEAAKFAVRAGLIGMAEHRAPKGAPPEFRLSDRALAAIGKQREATDD